MLLILSNKQLPYHTIPPEKSQPLPKHFPTHPEKLQPPMKFFNPPPPPRKFLNPPENISIPLEKISAPKNMLTIRHPISPFIFFFHFPPLFLLKIFLGELNLKYPLVDVVGVVVKCKYEYHLFILRQILYHHRHLSSNTRV